MNQIDILKTLQLIAEIETLRQSLKNAKEEDIPQITLQIATLYNELTALQQGAGEVTADQIAAAHAANQQMPDGGGA